ncbi:MAG: DNA alkylation repair protein, partial [Bacilli bacterium]
KLKKYINSFIPYIDNWAVCDSFAAGVRQFAKNLDLGFAYVMSLLSSSFPYSKRLGTVLLLIYYSKEPYMDAMIEVIPTIRDEDYYVKMGVAWLVSTLYIVNPKKTWVLLDGRLDSFIHSKSISKICDSYQVSDQDKIIAKSARKQKNQYKN